MFEWWLYFTVEVNFWALVLVAVMFALLLKEIRDQKSIILRLAVLADIQEP